MMKAREWIRLYQNSCDLFLLHEVPKSFAEQIANEPDTFLAVKDFQGLLPYNTNKRSCPVFYTVAIFKKDSYTYSDYYKDNLKYTFKTPGGGYQNRVIGLISKEKTDEIIVGVHSKLSEHECALYFDSLIRLHQKMPCDKSIIYLGDFNAFTPGRNNKRKLYEFMSEGLVDFWLENGKSNSDTTTNYDTRVDYVLVTDKDFNNLNKKYEMFIDDSVRLNGLSDHSAIILKERTPETKKTGD